MAQSNTTPDAAHVLETIRCKAEVRRLSAPLEALDSGDTRARARQRRQLDHARELLAEAYRPLVEKYTPRLAGMAWSLVRKSAQVEDFVQEALTGAFKGIDSLKDVDGFWGYLCVCARHARHRLYWGLKRDQEHCTSLEESQGEDGETRLSGEQSDGAADVERTEGPDAVVERMARSQDVEYVLRRIDRVSSEAYRAVLRLHFEEGLERKDIAERLSIPVGTAKIRLFRGTQALKQIVETDLRQGCR